MDFYQLRVNFDDSIGLLQYILPSMQRKLKTRRSAVPEKRKIVSRRNTEGSVP